jgi:iron complex outermembrane receptor protein
MGRRRARRFAEDTSMIAPMLLVPLLSALPLIQQPAQQIDSTRDSSRAVARKLERVTITAFRAGSAERAAPISQRTISREEIEQRSFGQEVPILLQGAPSITSYAETANFWGYSYIRLRGIDQSRINLTIDGIPLNDPEDEVLYFADFPDLASSLETVQIQRGVGTSSAGTASIAGSINFETTPLVSPAGGSAQLEGGSFGTKRVSAEYRSGLLANGFAFNARISGLESDGYRYHSGVLGRSALVSAGYFGARDVVKIVATAGLLHDTLSYLAVPDTELARDRRINPLQPNELDRFGEQIVSAAYTRELGQQSSWSTTLYRISASGNYDVAIDPDLWNYHLDFVWYGVTSAWNWQHDGMRVDAGVNVNRYARDHYAFIRPDLVNDIYFNTGHKGDVSGFGKVGYDLGRATLFGDVQVRRADFRYVPDVHADVAPGSISWTFVNPRAGLTYRLTPTVSAYASYGKMSREPARNDMLAGFDNLDTSNVAFVGPLSRVKPETVHDIESGINVRTGALQFQGNVFSMDFRNEIQPIGALSYLGLPLRKNVRASYRRGVELDATYRLPAGFTASANATIMRASIAEYTDDASAQTYYHVEPLLTPKVTSAQRLTWSNAHRVTASIGGRYTGRSQLDNTGDSNLILPAAYVMDGLLEWRFGRDRYAIAMRGENLTNSKRYGSGYGGDRPYYYVLPPRSVFVTLELGF